MALLRRIMHPKLNSASSDTEYINKLTEWQQVVREYEWSSGSELDQTVKTATLMEEAPPQMQEHLRLRSEELGTDYMIVIQAIEGHLRSKKTWNTGLMTWTLTLSASKGSPQERARAKAKERVTRARDSQKVKAKAKTKGKEKPVSQRARRIRNPTASVLFEARLDILPKIVITEIVQ